MTSYVIQVKTKVPAAERMDKRDEIAASLEDRVPVTRRHEDRPTLTVECDAETAGRLKARFKKVAIVMTEAEYAVNRSYPHPAGPAPGPRAMPGIM